MRKVFCDKCGDEITENVIMVFNHELCPKCANAVDAFITRSPRTPIMDALRNFCNNFSKNCEECPFTIKILWTIAGLKIFLVIGLLRKKLILNFLTIR